MIGAIIGDTVGSRFEWDNLKSKEFELLTQDCELTDDSIMTLAVATAIFMCEGDYSRLSDEAVNCVQTLGRLYPNAGYGGNFARWLQSENPAPYNSFGNGAAMRVSPCAYAAETLEEAKALSAFVTEVTHNHPEGIKGAEATTAAIFLALHGSSIAEIREYIEQNYYPTDFTLDELRPIYQYPVTCQGTVPTAIMAFLESTGFEDAIRNAVSIGGDSDTIAAITGSIAEAYYGVPGEMREQILSYMDAFQVKVLNQFEEKFGMVEDKPRLIP